MTCRCPIHRNDPGMLDRISQLLKQDHRLSDKSAALLDEIVREAYAKLERQPSTVSGSTNA